MKTIGLIGDEGGKIKQICNSAIVVPAEETADVQEYHLSIYFTLCSMLKAKLFKN